MYPDVIPMPVNYNTTLLLLSYYLTCVECHLNVYIYAQLYSCIEGHAVQQLIPSDIHWHKATSYK